LFDAADRWRELLRWAALQLLVVALFLPWMWYAAGGFLSTAAATPITLTDFLHIYWTVLTVGIPVDVAQFNRLTIPAAVILAAAVAAAVWSAFRQRAADGGSQTTDHRPRAETAANNHRSELATRHSSLVAIRDLTLLLVVMLLPAAIVYVVSLPKQNFYNPPFNPRYLVIFTPFYSILLAWGLTTLGQWMRMRGAGARGNWSKIVGGLVALGAAAFMVGVALIGLRPY